MAGSRGGIPSRPQVDAEAYRRVLRFGPWLRPRHTSGRGYAPPHRGRPHRPRGNGCAPPYLDRRDRLPVTPFFRNVVLDSGAVQSDALTVDRMQSLLGYEKLYERQEEIVETETQFLREVQADLVAVDIAPMACTAARRAACVAGREARGAWRGAWRVADARGARRVARGLDSRRWLPDGVAPASDAVALCRRT